MWLKTAILILAGFGKFVGKIICLGVGVVWLALSLVLMGLLWEEYLLAKELMSAAFSDGHMPLRSSPLEFTGFLLASIFWLGPILLFFVILPLRSRRKVLRVDG